MVFSAILKSHLSHACSCLSDRPTNLHHVSLDLEAQCILLLKSSHGSELIQEPSLASDLLAEAHQLTHRLSVPNRMPVRFLDSASLSQAILDRMVSFGNVARHYYGAIPYGATFQTWVWILESCGKGPDHLARMRKSMRGAFISDSMSPSRLSICIRGGRALARVFMDRHIGSSIPWFMASPSAVTLSNMLDIYYIT
jgi:hypothetical protein